MKKHYYTIGEVANLLEIKPFVIRYWETEFPSLKPRKEEGRIRKYSEENIILLKKIKDMLHNQRYTIEGARQKLKAERKHEREKAHLTSSHQLEIDFQDKGQNLSESQIQKLKELKKLLVKLKKMGSDR